MKSSAISGFYKKSPEERLEIVKEFAELSDDEADMLADCGLLDKGSVDRMVENVIGAIEIPLGVATNFTINGKDYLIPMATEEPSVIAAASNAAKMARAKGGFETSSTDPVMIGQIQVVDIEDPEAAKEKILSMKERFKEIANAKDAMLVKFGGGLKDIDVKILDAPSGKMLRVHLMVDTRDAMGANAVNTMAEAIATEIEEKVGGKIILRIISNLAIFRLARAKAVFDKDLLGGEESVKRIVQAYEFADADIFRAATHNKGIMNGIAAVVLATGNDHRAVEAGVHAFASMDGRYKPLTRYHANSDGDLVGEIELPLPLGTIGGATKVHPEFKACQKIVGAKSSMELAEVMAAVGLAQNLAALRALANEGIQKGHMALHARNIAVMAGAKPEQVDAVVAQMIKDGSIRMDNAKKILESM